LGLWLKSYYGRKRATVLSLLDRTDCRGLSRALKKGGWRCVRFGHVRKWLSNSAVKEKRSLGFWGSV
jgi:hypothetical protein